MNTLTFKLDIFEGPLELMLHLISKHKLDIYDIEISSLLEQYMIYIGCVQELDLYVASEFLEMAARLVYIKTVSLLPKHKEVEELKAELTGQLLEYQACKEAVMRLAEDNRGGDLFVREQADIMISQEYERTHEIQELYEAYIATVGKELRKLPPPAASFQGIVSHKIVSVTSRIIFILKKLYENNQTKFADFFENSDRSELVATFLAMLELVKAKRIVVSEDMEYLIFNQELELQELTELEELQTWE